MQKRTKLVVSILAGVMAITAVLGAVTYQVFAQTPTPATPTQSQGTGPGQGQLQPGPGRGGRGGHVGFSDADLASALGITTDQLTAAYKSANTEALKEAVSQGLITQAQADQMLANAGTGPIRLGFLGKPGSTSTIDYNALLAKALNISTDQLKAAQQKAMSAAIDAAVQAGTMTQAQADEMKGMNALTNDSTFQSAMKAAFDAALKQAVSSGVITQAQADAISQRQAQSSGFFGGGFGGDFGGGHGHGGPGGPDFNGGNNTTTQNN
jgi:hypothetical protein